jgi:hypothetical protein
MASNAFDYYGQPEPFELLAATSRFFQAAMKAHERFAALPAFDTAIQFIPLQPGCKRPAKGFFPSQHTDDPKDQESLALLAAAHPDSNVGVNSCGAVGGLTVVDCDEPGVAERYERETGRRLPLTYTTQTRPRSAPYKMNLHFITTKYSRLRLPKQVTNVTHVAGYDLKCNGGWGYVCAEGSVRDGEPVVALHDVPFAPMPDDFADWLAADIAKARSQKRKKPKKQKSETTLPRSFAVAHGDRKWAIKSRIRTYKNLGHDDEETFTMVSRDIRRCFEDGANYLAKLNLRSLIREVPTIGRNVSYSNLTHRRRRRRSSIKLADFRERFMSCPLDISAADARAFFSITNAADHRRLMREFHHHGYVYIGAHGSHSGIWSRPALDLSLPVKKPSSPIRIDSRSTQPHAAHLKKVCMRDEVALFQEVGDALLIHTRDRKNGGERAGAA